MNIFRLIIIIVIVLIVAGTSALAFVSAKSEAYDKKTLVDVDRIHEALKIYFDVNGFYPISENGLPYEIDQYLSFYPTNDNCPYTYERRYSNDYMIRYCLESGESFEAKKSDL